MSIGARFIRLNPRFGREETCDLLKSEIELTHPGSRYPLQVPWLLSQPHGLEFFAIPGDFSLNKAFSFQSGRVYGMDVTSGAAVASLLLDIYDRPDGSGKRCDKTDITKKPLRVLDLCCAPGLKLCMIADLVPHNSLVVGVDSAKHRISLCKNIIHKYHINQTTSGIHLKNMDGHVDSMNSTTSQCADSASQINIRIYHGDGTTFKFDPHTSSMHELVFDSKCAFEEQISRGKRKRMNKSAKAREKRRLLELSSEEMCTKNREKEHQPSRVEADKNHRSSNGQTISSSKEQFDRILVDAECSSDGAIRQIQMRQSSKISKQVAWDDSNMNELVDLQKRLLGSGFRLLKNGGFLVYSTCSMMIEQNEDVVNWLLKEFNNASIIPVSFSQQDASTVIPCGPDFIKEGAIPGTVRFTPQIVSDTSSQSSPVSVFSGGGFFLAKIGKGI